MPATQAISVSTPANFALTAGRKRLRALALACAPCVLGALAAASPAAAQTNMNTGAQDLSRGLEAQRNVGVRDRPRPDYDALGVRAGAFLLYPKVTIDGTYDDNIYATNANKVSSGVVTGSGQITGVSNWSRHQLTGFVRGARAEYTDQNSESNTTYGLGASGQLDVQRDFNLTGLAQFDHLIEARTASGTPTSASKPISYDNTQFNIGASKIFNRIRIRPGFSYSRYNYSDFKTNAGTPVSQAYRDEKGYVGALQIDYALSPDTSIYVQGKRDWLRFDEPVSATNPLDRNSDGYQINVGTDFNLTALARGHVQVGYLNHQYDSSSLNGVSSIGLDASVEYYPTQLLTITLTGSRSVGDTGLTNSAGYLTTNGGVQADYELLRNLILTGKVAFGRDDYRGIDRKDNRFIGTFGAIYLINRSLGVNLLYTRQDQSSSGVLRGPDFGINRFSVALTLQR